MDRGSDWDLVLWLVGLTHAEGRKGDPGVGAWVGVRAEQRRRGTRVSLWLVRVRELLRRLARGGVGWSGVGLGRVRGFGGSEFETV